MASLEKELLKKQATTSGHLLPPSSSGAAAKNRRLERYLPSSWDKYFEATEDVTINSNRFKVYRRGSDGPLLYLIHGGGHSSLSWCVFAAAISQLVHCQVLAIDLRGHGESHTVDDDDLSNDTLISDLVGVYNELYKEGQCPPTLLMGHSMGGAIAVRLAAAGLIKSLVGLAVIDVVEGTALQSLSGMQSFLRGRPTSFRSLDQAIEWSIRSGQLRNIESAKVSMPGQLMRIDKTDTDGCTDDNVMYKWRVDLTSTERYWKEWFQGLSSVLLSTSIPKILLLAGVDRLDKELTIGHMQGKFQMQVLSGCGHAVHEDVPDQVAKIVAGFMVRYKLAAPKESFQRLID